MVEEKKYVKLRWQNLIHKKCPACDSRMILQRQGYECPQKKEGLCNFFVPKKKYAEILTDPNHPAVRFLNDHEKQMLDQALKDIGIDNVDEFWRAPVKDDIIPEKSFEN